MFGGGGLNPRKMKQMMKQMGIDVDEIDAEEVIIRTSEEDLVFENAEVTRMDAQGQRTYQVVGEPESRPRGSTGAVEAGAVEAGEPDTEGGSDDSGDAGIPDADVEIVAQRTGASEAEAREALEETGGDLAAAVARLE